MNNEFNWQSASDSGCKYELASLEANQRLSAEVNQGIKISAGAPRITSFFDEPGNGTKVVTDAIRGARESVDMWNFHLTDPLAVQALKDADSKNHADVEVILDRDQIEKDAKRHPERLTVLKQLQDAGVNAMASSDGFTISHPKTFLIDGKSSYITTMNLTPYLKTFRDVGVSTDDPMIANDLEELFEADKYNATHVDEKTGTGKTETPAMLSPFLVVSPIDEAPDKAELLKDAKSISKAVSALPEEQREAALNAFDIASPKYTSLEQLRAEQELSKLQNGDELVQLFAEKMQDQQINRIQSLIDKAQTKVVGEVENISAKEILNSIINAASRGVEVSLIIPEQFGIKGQVNSNQIAEDILLEAGEKLEAKGLPGIHIKEMPVYREPKPGEPYMHAKWLVADDKEAYLGSVNYSYNSLHKAREIGLILNDKPAMQEMVTNFNEDWAVSKDVPERKPS